MDKGVIFCKLAHLAEEKGITIRIVPLNFYDGRIKGNIIGIRQSLKTIDEYNYNLAHELAHAYLHYDKGNILPNMENKELYKQYEEVTSLHVPFVIAVA